jgi:hypothetical protein
MEKMMKQFGKTMLTVMGLAVAAAVLSPIPAQAASPVVVAHAFDANVGWFTLLDPNNPFSLELVTFDVESTGNKSYMLGYSIFDFGGGFSASGNGSIPASSVTVSGGSVNSGNLTVTLNVNTCDVAGFTTLPSGTCGPFNVAWVELPASIGGSSDFRGDSRSTCPERHSSEKRRDDDLRRLDDGHSARLRCADAYSRLTH